MLAAGPERIVSTGRLMAHSALISEPSPFTTSKGAAIPRSRKVFWTLKIKVRNKGIKLAFRETVVALRMEFRRLVSSCPHVTGRSVNASTIARARISCSGFLVPK